MIAVEIAGILALLPFKVKVKFSLCADRKFSVFTARVAGVRAVHVKVELADGAFKTEINGKRRKTSEKRAKFSLDKADRALKYLADMRALIALHTLLYIGGENAMTAAVATGFLNIILHCFGVAEGKTYCDFGSDRLDISVSGAVKISVKDAVVLYLAMTSK